MINIIEKARKQAGIASLELDRPPKKQRGARYWSSFVLAVRVNAEHLGDQLLAATKENARLGNEINRLQAELHEKNNMLIKHGLKDVVRGIPALTAENRTDLLSAVG